jgi:hypothetical protein
VLPYPLLMPIADCQHVADNVLQLDHARAVERRDRMR